MTSLSNILRKFSGIVLSVLIGFVAFVIHQTFRVPLLDPIFLSLCFGILLKFFINPNSRILLGVKKAPSYFIPVGVLLYGASDLDFQRISSLKIDFIFLMLFVFIIFILISLSLSAFLGLKEKTGYLLTTGTSVCGVSAIVIASQAIDAQAEDISIGLIAVFTSALFGLFILFPLLDFFLKFSDVHYAVLSGSVLQITGFVKVAVRNLGVDSQALALSVKTARYLGLFLLVPFFGSLVKGKVHIPWFLWGFLITGCLFSYFQNMAHVFRPLINPILDLLWSVAMAAVGLAANSRMIFSRQGLRAVTVSFASLLVGVVVFVLGLFLGA